jgi:Domain of unknown function (DUF4192)
MTQHDRDFDLNRPGALIAALPAVLGFVPERSLVLVSIECGQIGAVMRVDLSDAVPGESDRLAQVVAGARPDAVIVVIVDAEGALCPKCNEDYRQLSEGLAAALGEHHIEVMAVHVVDHVQAGGRWHCVDGCGAHGSVEDPAVSPLTVAAVVDGRRVYGSRADLQTVIATEDPDRTAALAAVINGLQTAGHAERSDDPDGCTRKGVRSAIEAVNRVGSGEQLTDAELAELGYTLTDITARDTLYALAVGRDAGAAETLWTILARSLPLPWRTEALVLLAFSAYARGDGPLAGISLDEAIRGNPEHRMAGMLDSALLSGMRPEQIRQLALTGFRVAERLGVRLPPRRSYGRRAG